MNKTIQKSHTSDFAVQWVSKEPKAQFNLTKTGQNFRRILVRKIKTTVYFHKTNHATKNNFQK